MIRITHHLLTPKDTEALRIIFNYLSEEKRDFEVLPPSEQSKHVYHFVRIVEASGLLKEPRFELGRTYVTALALKIMERTGTNPADLLRRHALGDWGDVSAEDLAENETNLKEDSGLLLSVYRVGLHSTVYVLTEADRFLTTILTPEEY